MSDKNKAIEKPDRTLKSPFKFLAPYSASDKDAFWGRDAEIQELYEMLFATNMVLLYGPSGTGKTSLVQCGLSKKFSGPDWIPLMIRRGEDFVTSLKDDLQALSNLPESASVPEHIIHIYNTYYRPVYLFFDQFEEIFTLAKRDQNGKVIQDAEGKLPEVRELLAIIRQLSNTLPCKVVFIFREEFLGRLYNYEQYLPNLFDFRLRVEPMNTVRITEVLEGSFNYFNITCDPPEIANSIADNLLEGKATSQLAYLQVYMDKLWKTAYKESYKDEWQAGFPPPPVTITRKTLAKVGDVQKVLEVYLQEQENAVSRLVGIKGVWVRELLDSFVTDDGTKRPIAESSTKLNPKNRLDPSQLNECLAHLEEARLIRRDNQYYELAHDTLAGILANKRTASQRLIREITQSIRTSYNLPTKGDGSYLNEEYVALYDKYQVEIADELEGDEDKEGIIQYIEDSRRNNAEKKRALEEKNRRLRRSLKRSRQFVAAIGVLFIISVWTVYFAWLVDNNSKALYWATEAENISPEQGLLLLQSADSISFDEKVTNPIIRKQTIKIFNDSWRHRFRGKMRFQDYLPSAGNQRFIAHTTYDNGDIEYQVWDLDRDSLLNTIKIAPDLSLIEFSPSGNKMLISNLNSSKYWVMDTDRSLKQKASLLFNQKKIQIASFSFDGKWLFTQNSQGTARVWNLTKKKGLSYIDIENEIRRAEFSKDGKWLLTAGEYGTYKVWAMAQGQVPDFLKNLTDIAAAEFSDDGRWLLTTDLKGYIQVRDMDKGQKVGFLPKNMPISKAVFSENGEWLYTLESTGKSRIWQTSNGSSKDFLKNEKNILLLSFSPNGNWLYTKNAMGESFIWETATGRKYDVFRGNKEIWNASISSDGRWIFTKDSKGKSHIWDRDGEVVLDFFYSEQNITNAWFSDDGKFLYTADTNGFFHKWELNKKENEVLPLAKQIINQSFSPDKKLYYLEYEGNRYKVFNTGKDSVPKFLKRDEYYKSVEFSADGNWVLLKDLMDVYRLYNTKKDTSSYFPSKVNISKAEFSADRKWNATPDSAGNYYLREVSVDKVVPNQEKQHNMQIFPFGKYQVTITGHKIITKDTTNGKILQTFFVNTKPSQVQLVENHLYVVAGWALFKTDIQKQDTFLFSYGDGTTLDYSYDEIKEWIGIFGDEVLGDLDQRTIEKYRVGKPFQVVLDMLETFWKKLSNWISGVFGSE